MSFKPSVKKKAEQRADSRRYKRQQTSSLKNRLKTNDYPDDIVSSTPVATTGVLSKARERLHRWAICRPILGLFVKGRPIDLGPPSAIRDFDALNQEFFQRIPRRTEGDTHLFPYSYMDSGKILPVWNSWSPSAQQKQDGPAKIYVVTNQHHSAIKVGITSLSSSNSRINEHIRNGWKLESQRNVASLRLALNIEQSIIRWWRSELSAKPCLTQQQMPQGGYTETASLSDVEIVSTLERISSLLAETGEEKIHSIDFPNLIVGSLVQGEANILAKVVWDRPRHKQNVGSRPVFGEKFLVGTHPHFLTLEFLQDAHGTRYLPSIGGSIKFRGRVQKIGDVYRIANPWIYSSWDKPPQKPTSKFDLC
jgi:hypothetical protein